METLAERLQKARKLAGFDSPTDAARANGWVLPTYLSHENGTRGFPQSRAQVYAERFRVRLDWLISGKGTPRGRNVVPLVGFVGAGAVVFPVDDHEKGAGLDELPGPSWVEGPCVVVQIRGDSMLPLRDGWKLIYSRDHEGVPDNALNRLCVCKVIDGRTFVKELRRGSRKGLYRLVSWALHAADIDDVKLEWAAPVLEIRTE